MYFLTRKTGEVGMKYIVNITFILIAAIGFLSAREVGKFSYKGAPEDFDSSTIVVSDTMVAMSEKVYVKVQNQFVIDSVRDTPSIFFVIDHSLSMSYDNGNNPVNDQWGNRFTVTSAFIDSIYKMYPAAEIGFCVFAPNLYMRPQDDTMFDTINAAGYTRSNGSYLPLLRLNQTYTSTPYSGTTAPRTGLSILKYYLQTDSIASPGSSPLGGAYYRELHYHPITVPTGTNITVGFEAAKSAMQRSRHPTENQYVIFLSDGAANYPNNNNAVRDAYIAGTNVPTTFTVFFTQSTAVPANIATMTTNIQNNLYSGNNGRSNAWPFYNASFSSLMNFLMVNVYSVITIPQVEKPARITIGTQTATSWVDSAFTFGRLFPLSTGPTTPFNYTITYHLTKDSVLVKDTSHTVYFNVQRTPGIWLDPALYDVKYWDRDLSLRFNGTTLATTANAAVTVINEAMATLEARFDFDTGTARYKYTTVQVEISNTNTVPRDKEMYTLTKGSTNFFSRQFTRAVSASPVAGNGVLEHASPDDTIIAIFRNRENPALPLDTLKIACPIHVTPGAQLRAATTRDINGNGLIDRINITFDKHAIISKDATGSLTVLYGNIVFYADSIIPISDTAYAVYIRERQTNALNPVPQTSWTPRISITNLPGVETVNNFATTDGCPAVVWRVVKHIISDTLWQDTVTIYMSEKIYGPGGYPQAFSPTNQPPQTFRVWLGNSTVAVDTMLEAIGSFTKIINDSILVFAMSNGHDLNTDHWVNIRWASPVMLDRPGNAPAETNQRVRVEVEGSPTHIVIPRNPSGPSVTHVQTPILEFKHTPEASKWVNQGPGGGVVIAIKNIIIPTVDKDKVKAYWKIYDMAGNIVTWASTDNFFGSIPDGLSLERNEGYQLYWNGLNRKGMTVAPGIYRSVIYIDYPSSSRIRDLQLVSKIGMHR
jgi:hypothetical protein